MPTVVVYTEKGEQVWSMEGVHPDWMSAITAPTNVKASGLVAGLRRAVQDADKIERGIDPERASEKAMRLSE